MKLKARITSIETRCTANARAHLKLHFDHPLLPHVVDELRNVAGVLTQFEIERAINQAKSKNTGKAR